VRFATTRGATEQMFMQNTLLDIFETAPFKEVQRGINKQLNRPTQFMVLKPEQIHTHLSTGHVQFAFVDAEDEATVLADNVATVVARPVFEPGPPTSTAVFVVAPDSPIEGLKDLAGKRVAFGPPNHPAMHWGALEAIEAAGVKEADLAKQIVPIPGSLQFHFNSIESAKAALFKIEADVGVIDEADYLKWPETGGNVLSSAFSISFSRDQVKVIGKTEPIPLFPSGAVVASRKADPALVSEVREYLTQVVPGQQRITKPLGLVKYVPNGGEPAKPTSAAAATAASD
jgi:ABC-type phosphate/phosphonate transport system substrate-binding protein